MNAEAAGTQLSSRVSVSHAPWVPSPALGNKTVQILTSVVEDVQKLKPFYTAGRNIK